jgi:Ni/Fe-hydrogenase subunit HybB-like protein
VRTTTSNPTLERVKNILWAIMGVWTVVTIARFTNGLGATSALTDAVPWGFWIAFDVMAGVALAAGGFVIAAAVYVFGLKRYHQFARPAILTALLGYLAVAVGLLYDLGLPWHIWHPMIMPQHHSVLFEVAMCVMCYLTVLSLEFSPAILEHPLFHGPFFQKLLRVVKALTIPLVIAGITLSCLHQSSLGSLFLIQPYRLHPLWYSPIMWVLYLISAIGLGLMMVTLESLLSAWLFGHASRTELLAGLGKMASWVLAVYVLLRVGDLWYRGVLPHALDGSLLSGLFLFELLFSAVVPATLLAFRRVRESIPGLATCSTMVVLGIIGYRFDTCIIAFARPAGMSYFPTWIELAVSAGVVSGAILVFIFFNENLRIVEHDETDPPADAPSAPAPAAETRRVPYSFTPAIRRHSLCFIVAAAVAIGLLPREAIHGPQPRRTPVLHSRQVEALAVEHDSLLLRTFHLSSLSANVSAAVDPRPTVVTMIDGNRNWRFVSFTHDDHTAALGGRESCRICHHQNMTFDQNTACYQCHRDMYEVTDTFDHTLHVNKLGDNASCAVCHPESDAAKSRETSLACWQCHGDMVVAGSIIPTTEAGLTGFAPGYMDAMHGLCIRCHEQMAKEQPEVYGEHFARCDFCHREFQDTDHRRLAPYVPMPPAHVRVEPESKTATTGATDPSL